MTNTNTIGREELVVSMFLKPLLWLTPNGFTKKTFASSKNITTGDDRQDLYARIMMMGKCNEGPLNPDF